MAWPGLDPIAFLRAQVDEVDDELALLLARRFALTATIQGFKSRPGQEGRDPEREQEIARRMATHAPGLGAERISRIMRTVIDESLDAYESRSSRLMEIFGDLVETYRAFAEDARGSSPCFEAWASAVAEDPDVLAWLAELPERKRQPNLVFAAARWHGVAAPGPYDGLRAALLGDTGELRRTIMARSTQTNEIGRLATLLPAFATIGDELALLEVGASAGLCLYPDRHDYRWVTPSGDRGLRGSGGSLLSTVVEGELPVPERHPLVRWRAGIDLNPLDVSNHDQMAWLATLVWPEQDDRRVRLRSAVDLARADPPRIVEGDLLAELPGLLSEAPGVPIVFHSAVAVYLEPSQRQEFVAMMTGLVQDGACHWVSNEGARVLPGVAVPEPAVPSRFLLCVDKEPVAWTHGHGRWIRWL